MKRSKIRMLIIISTLLTAGLVVTQFFWVKKTYVLEQKQFGYNVSEALRNVVSTIREHSGDSTALPQPVREVQENLFLVRTQDTLHSFYLKSLLKAEFAASDIQEDFRYHIYDCFSDSIVFYETVSYEAGSAEFSSDSGQNIPEAPQIKTNHDDGHYFSVYFFNRSKSIWKKMHFWVYSSLIVLSVILFFAFTMHTILKQKKISEIKNDFINNMTHEFKTPLSTIDLSSKAMLRKNPADFPEKFKHYARIINTENDRLQNRVERILQIAGIEGNELRINRENIDIHDVLRQTAESFEMLIKERNGRLTLRLNAEKSVVNGDEAHLYNVFNNLIDNALKYGSEENPEICFTTSNESNMIRIDISDNGQGIAQKDLKKIFDKFYRVHSSDQHDVKGFGIGLNYVKVMVEAHSGKVKVKSSRGEGSVFSVFLPVPGIK